MTEQALAALKESIEHWRRLYTGKLKFGEGIGPRDCALCRQFNKIYYSTQDGRQGNCDGCPVKERTGLNGCVGTPYDACKDFLDNDEHSLTDGEFQDLALLELEFLESLLPKEEHVTTTNEVQQPNSGGPE